MKANNTPEAAALREAATTWGQNPDRAARRHLLGCAIKYARKADETEVPKLVTALKRALNWIDSREPSGPGDPLPAWAEIHDDLIGVINQYDPKWTPGDEP